MQDHIILDVCGIGYLVYTTQNIMSSLTLGAKAEFYTEQHITENSVKLYGLQSKEDIKVLKVLIKAKGVNYKTAITLIDKLGARDPYGIRPLVLGKLGDDYVLTSETCALDVMNASFVRDVKLPDT